MDYLICYFVVAFIFMILNSIVSGYQGETYSYGDFKDSILWPLALSVLIGLSFRVMSQKILNFIAIRKELKPKSKGK